MALGPFSWDGIRSGSIMTSLPKTPSWLSGQTKAAGRMARPARPRRRHWLQFWGLAAMLSAASAVSLNDLEPIADGVLPTMCNMAYNTPFTGCTVADFESGTRCSDACRDGIKMIEDVVDKVCDDVSATRDTVLGFAKRGVLLLHTCDGNGDDITLAQTSSTTSRTTTSIQAPPTSVVVPPTIATSIPIIPTPPVSTTTSRSIGSFTIIPTPEPPTVSSTQVVPPPQPTASDTSSLTIIPPIPTPSSTSSQLSMSSTTDTQTSSQTVTQSLNTFVTSASTSTTTSATKSATAAQTGSSSQDDGDGDGQGRGGGSPFDTQVSLSPRLCADWPLCLTVGAMLLGAMFR